MSGSRRDGSGTEAATQSVLNAIRLMFLRGELYPADPLRQETLATRLGVSRVPVREALRMLEAEGVVKHTQNAGYTVAELDGGHVAQAYLMRRTMERELLAAIGDVSAEDVADLRAINSAMAAALHEGDMASGLELNSVFHFRMFEISRLDLVIDNLRRVWSLTDPYRSLMIYDEDTAPRIVAEHELLVDHLEAGDLDELVRQMDVHRRKGEQRIGQILNRLEQRRGHKRQVAR